MTDFVDTMPGIKKPVPPLISSRSCMELGLCQRKKPACLDCEHDSAWCAPISMEGPFHPKTLASRLRHRLARLWARHWGVLVVWGCMTLALAWCAVLTSFAIGYAQRRSGDFSWAQLMQASQTAWAAVQAVVAQWVGVLP